MPSDQTLPQAEPLLLTLDPGHMRPLYPLLERGVTLATTVNVCVLDLLMDGLGLSQADVESVQTVFLDSKPADDLRESTVKDGTVVALSAAMPGLMGATMRRDGTYASLRSSISHHSDPDAHDAPRPGHITLKLFNHMLDSFAERVLAKGVLVAGKHLNAILAPLHERLAGANPVAEIRGQRVDLTQFELGLPDEAPILFTVRQNG